MNLLFPLLLLLVALAQGFTTPLPPAWEGQQAAAIIYVAPAGSFSPTNISGVTNHSWWVADNITDATAANAVTNWVDYGLTPSPLTNPVVTQVTRSNYFLNGHAIVHFTGLGSSTHLRTSLYTNPQPHEVSMVVRFNTTTNTTLYLFDGYQTAGRNAVLMNNGVSGMTAGTLTAMPVFPTNQWFVLTAVFNGTNSGVFVNNVSLSGPVNPGAGACNGIVVGANNSRSGPLADFAEIVTYRGTFGNVDSQGVFSAATNRTALYGYLTNKYGLGQ